MRYLLISLGQVRNKQYTYSLSNITTDSIQNFLNDLKKRKKKYRN